MRLQLKPSSSIKPDPEDYAAIEREYGPLKANATDAECADRYREAQAAKLLRMYGPEKPVKRG